MENSQKTHSFCGIISATAIVMASVSLAISLGLNSGVKPTSDSAANAVATDEVVDAAVDITGDVMYNAQIEDGRVAVRDGDGNLVMIFKTPVLFMAKDDREYFEHGVAIYSDDELASLADDFGG